MEPMKTITLDGVTYEITDAQARETCTNIDAQTRATFEDFDARTSATFEIVDEQVKAISQHKAGTTLSFDVLRCPGISTTASEFYATLVLDRPIDPDATYTLAYTGMYVRGAGTQINDPTTIELEPDSGGHALTLHIAKASAFTQYETYVAVFTGATITITAS